MSTSNKPSLSKICVLPWNHLFLANNSFRYPCCLTQYPEFEVKPDNELLNSMKREMLNGALPEVCRVCANDENAGKKSYRHHVNEWFKDTEQAIKDGSTSGLDTEFIDIRIGNLCNLKCRMCQPNSSHLLIPEFESFGASGYMTENLSLNEKAIKDYLKISKKIKRVSIAGGEPLVTPLFFELIDRLCEEKIASNIDLAITTNLTVYKTELIEKLVQFKSVHIIASIDGMEKVNSYIRFPSVWNRTIKNLELYRGAGFSTSVNYTSQIYNVFSALEFYDYFLKKNGFKINLNFLNAPLKLNIKNLPPELKKLVQSLYTTNPIWPTLEKELNPILNFMNEEQIDKWPDFIKWTRHLDFSRKQNICEFVPELVPYVN